MNETSPRPGRWWPPALVATLAFVAAFAAIAASAALGTRFGGSGLPLDGRRAVLILGVGVYLALPVLLFWLLVGGLARLSGARPPGTAWAVALGVLLSIVPMAVGILIFRDGDDPRNLAGYLAFWRRVPSAFWLGLLPYAISGAAFGGLFGRARRPRSTP